MRKLHVFTVILLCVLALSGMAQNRQAAFDMNTRLGRGVNMGNCFEAPSENEWGNPWKPEYFKIMADLGFDHVRLPVRWEPADRSMAAAPYTINPTFFNRIQQVVDTARKYKLHIIVNMHHHEALFDNPDGQKERFLSQWYQIADYFKNYPDTLLFEVMNEPHGNLTPEKWNTFFADALTEIRKTNPTRMVLMGTADYGGLGGLSKLQVPNDDNVIVTVHYYNPFNFTHQGAEWVGAEADAWLGTKWFDIVPERETVQNEFRAALDYSTTNNVPVHVGEFGAYSKADIESRERWTTYLGRYFEEENLSWAYWEFSAGFGIYNPTTKQFVEPLVNALFLNPMPEPTPVFTNNIYTSNFSAGTDGWSLNANSGAAGSLTASAGKLNVTINNGGSQAWHVQLTKSPFAFQKDKMYRITFKAKGRGYKRRNLLRWKKLRSMDFLQWIFRIEPHNDRTDLYSGFYHG
ncbi:MAG: cellulase family glycosylhydrolase [Cyclobacteriaceae bacterium]|nr:cellulase family glycosylhydrolase [Cyclobacteriaceae bacterium]